MFEDQTTQEILEGGHDATLDELAGAIKARRQVLRNLEVATKAANLMPGDKVRITMERPRYLKGATAEIVRVRVTKAEILFPEQMGLHDPYRKYAGRIWIFPIDTLEKIEE